MISMVVIYLAGLTAARSREMFFLTVVSIGLLVFHAMPEQVPFLVRLATMVATQIAMGNVLQRRTLP